MREEERFTEYVQNYNPEDSQIRLKIIHTWKVVSAADQIAENLNLSEEERSSPIWERCFMTSAALNRCAAFIRLWMRKASIMPL